MFSGFIKIAFRKILGNKILSIIKILSLSVSIFSCVLIFQWINFELSYDKFHKDYKQIFRLNSIYTSNDETNVYAPVCSPIGDLIKENISQVEYSARTFVWLNPLIKNKDIAFYENRVIAAEPDFIQIFDLRFIHGSPDVALSNPNSVLLTESAAKKYFGLENPLGKILLINDNSVEITGVIQDCKPNSVVQYDFIISLSTWSEWVNSYDWNNPVFFSYLKLEPDTNIKLIIEELNQLAFDATGNAGINFSLEPISKVYLNKPLRLDENIHGSKVYLWILSIIGLFILILGSINFMNLSITARHQDIKEIAIRKIVGSSRLCIIWQLIIESLIFSFIAVNLAFYMLELVQSSYNAFIGKNLTLNLISNWYLLLTFLLFGTFIGLISGIYPSVYLSNIKAVSMFTQKYLSRKKGVLIRKVFVVIQFAISAGLIVSAIIIYLQVNYMMNYDLGFDSDNKMIVQVRGGLSIENDYEKMESAFLQNPDVINFSVSSSSIGKNLINFNTHLSTDPEISYPMYYMYIDDGFLEQYNIEIIEGRNFDSSILGDISSLEAETEGSFIINQCALKTFGWNNPEEAIGKELKTSLGDRNFKIIGVIKDFNFKGLENEIEPLVMEFFPGMFRVINITISNITDQSVRSVKQTWESLFPGYPFDYYFLTDDLSINYNKEQKAGQLISFFAVLGIFISVLGLFGLTIYTTELKVKEIGIKKALGASVLKIVSDLSSGFLWLVFFANLLSWPVVYYFMSSWLHRFSYRIEMPFWVFVLTGFITLLIAQLTIAAHALIAANRNPVEALRYE